jgi:F-type H+-transporting ATPase subunit b
MAIMSTFSFLATAAAEVAAEGGSEGGLGLNFDLLETNLINLVIIIGVLFFFGRKFLGKNPIRKTLKPMNKRFQDAEKTAERAARFLSRCQQNGKSQAEAEKSSHSRRKCPIARAAF